LSDKSDNEAARANLKEADCQLPVAERHDLADKRLYKPVSPNEDGSGHTDLLPLTELYWKDVHPFSPFGTPEMLDSGETGTLGKFMGYVEFCLQNFLQLLDESEDLFRKIREVTRTLENAELSMPIIAGTLLLNNFLRLSNEVLQRVNIYIP
jgi:hypothetical protein